MSLNINQFSQSVVKGMLALGAPKTQVISCKVNTGSTLVPGQPVKLVDQAGKEPVVAALAADTDVVFGFVAYNIKDQSFLAGHQVEIVRGWAAETMWMEASEAIAPGDNLMVVLTGVKVAVATSGKPISGVALDKAALDGDLIRVDIVAPSKLNEA